MSTMQKVILIGYVGRDPETRFLSTGDPVTNFSVATTERWKKDGQAQERTEWHRINCFGKLAEIAGEYLKKGSHVYVEGKIQSRKWEDKDGTEKTAFEIRANEIKFLGRAPGDAAAAVEERTPSKGRPLPKQPPAKTTSSKQTGFEDMPDDIPF